MALGLSVKKCHACAELETQDAGDGRAGGEVDAAFGAGGLAPEALGPLLTPLSPKAVELKVEPKWLREGQLGVCRQGSLGQAQYLGGRGRGGNGPLLEQGRRPSCGALGEGSLSPRQQGGHVLSRAS